jgi:hypothetical protein
MTTILESPTNIYIPPNSLTLDKAPLAQRRVGIQGFPGTGKTWSALTFPNPIVINIDRGLGAHHGRKDVIELPFYDKEFCKKIYPAYPDRLKEVVLTWLNTYAHKLTKDQTLIFDGLTAIDSAYHTDWKKYPAYSKGSGKVDDWAEWGLKLAYFGELCDVFYSLNCNVVFISHESEKKDKSGEYTGKIRPLMQGSFVDKIVGKFTDWFRQLSADKPKDWATVNADNIKSNWGMSVSEFKAMCDTYPRNTIYYWQLEGDSSFDGKCSSLVNFPRFIPSNYASFSKYLRVSQS